MNKRKIAAIIVAALTINTAVPNIKAFAAVNNVKYSEVIQSNEAKVSRFETYYSKYKDAYDKVFKMDNSNIKNITSSGGILRDNVSTANITDGNLDTYWETGKHTSNDFENELTFTLQEETTLNRIAYRSAWNTVGFAEDFEILSSETEVGDDFKLVAEAKATKTADVVEIKFNPTKFKRIKFVFKNNGTATASEMMFYEEDTVLDKANRLFTDNSMSKVSDEFNNKEAIDNLELELKEHPLYEEYKENIENARSLLNQIKIESSEATVSKFDTYYSSNREAYDKEFKMDNSNIQTLTSTGGSLRDSVSVSKIIDGKLDTYWETGKHTTNDFKNELIFTLRDETVLNRIAYRSAWNTVGFAENFEIWASSTTKGDTFQLVTSATASKTADMVEIKFNPTKFKRIKFVFKNSGTATVSEMMFYKEDSASDKVKTIFTDNTFTKVSEEFNSLESLNTFEESVKNHPLYNEFKQIIEDAKAVVSSKEIVATEATMRQASYVANEKYNDLYRMSYENIQSISNNGGHYASQKIEYAVDGDLSSYWETSKGNNSTFNNEVEVTFKNSVKLDRIVYAPRQSDLKGFATKVEIYASTTSKGDTYQLVATGAYNKVSGFVEAKFNETEFKRVKFKFVNSDQNWASLSEIMFYTKDDVQDAVDRLFTDKTLSKVSEEFNTIEKLNELEEKAKTHPLYSQLKESIENAKIVLENKKIEATETTMRKASYVENEDYNNLFKVSRDKIESISNNGGKYWDQVIGNAIDGNLSTYWETATGNSNTFKNEVEITFKDTIKLDRVVYAPRQSDLKGFATKVEIYASTTSKGDTYQLVATGAYNKVSGFVEAKFNETEFKRVKFKFVNSDQNWASLSEIMFYTKDDVQDAVDRLFTDNTLSKVSEEFNTKEKLNALEEKAKEHPLYNELKESIDNAKIVVENKTIEATKANMSKVDYNENDEYNKLYRISSDKIKSIKTNGGQYASQKIENAIDGDLSTYWETGSLNGGSFTNEVEVEFNDIVKFDRLVYGSRQSDLKGFATEVEIYGTTTSKGDTYQLIATGSYNKVSGLVEAKFNETEFKRIKFKFKKSDQNSATLNEIMFYKSDEVWNSVDSLFTDGTMSAISDKFNGLNEISALEETAKTHPLYESKFKEIIDLAKEVLNNPVQQDVMELEMRGNSVAETNNRKMWGFQDWQVTGMSAVAGDVITVYVDVEDGEPTPTLLYRQAATQHGGATTFQLKKGKNVITIPTVDATSNGILSGTIQGGELFFTNYSSDSQTRAPKVRIEGAKKYPIFVLGKSDETEVMKELEAYVAKIKENPSTTPNVFAVSGEKSLGLVQATYALDWYTKNNKTPKYTAERWDQIVREAMGFWGFDGSSEINSDYNFRIMPMMKNLTGGVFMNAHAGIIGIRPGNQNCIVGADVGWGTMHELGHNFDTTGRAIAEVTNNIMPLFFGAKYEGTTRLTKFDVWSRIYPKVGLDDYSNNALYNVEDTTDLAQITPLWQLYLYDNTFYGKFEQQFRANNYGNKTREDIYKSWVVAASDAMKLDLTEFFERHGIRLSDEAKAEISAKYQKPDKKIYYINDKAINYTGNGFTEDVNVSVKTVGSNGNVKLVFSIDEANKNNLLGYEIRKDGKYIGFAYNDSFVDTSSNLDDDAVYTVTPYDIKLNAIDEIEVGALQPTISVNPVITIGLGEEFNAKSYIVAKDMKGNSIVNSVKVESNVNTSRTGEYEVVYSVEGSGGIVYSAKTKVNVVANQTFLSDMTATSTKNGWGTVRKDKSISGGTISLKRGEDTVTYAKGLGLHAYSEYVYDLEGKDYEYFESYIGGDRNSNSSLTSIEFKVYVDGVEKYNSGVMTRDTDQKYVKVDVKGAKELKLVITDAGNGTDADHGDWAGAKLFTMESKPTITGDNLVYSMDEEVDLMNGLKATDFEDGDITKNITVKSSDFVKGKSGVFTVVYTVIDSDGLSSDFTRFVAVVEDEVQLSSLNWNSASIGSGSIGKNKAVSGNAIRLLDENNQVKKFDKGIGTHSYSEIVYNSEGYDVFDTWVGIDQHVAGNTSSSVIFKVYVDGVLKAQTDVMKSNTPMERLTVDVRNSKQLKLVVETATNGNTWDHADWANARFLKVANYDRTELTKALEEAKALDVTAYTDETVNALKEAIAKGEETLTSKDQTVIDAAVKAIKDAVDALAKKVDFTTLEEAINQNSDLNELHYFKDAITAHKALIEEGKEVLANKEATQEEVDAILNKINESSKNLVVRENKVELEKKINEAKEIQKGSYQEVRWNNFLYGIDYASSIYNNQNATDEEVSTALFMLDYFKSELK